MCPTDACALNRDVGSDYRRHGKFNQSICFVARKSLTD